jgi:hypothetical protein
MVMAPIINRDGIWEKNEVKWLKENVRPCDSCINVGANVEYFAILMSQLTGKQGSVFAFEANSLSATFRFDLHHSPSINLLKLKAYSRQISLDRREPRGFNSQPAHKGFGVVLS